MTTFIITYKHKRINKKDKSEYIKVNAFDEFEASQRFYQSFPESTEVIDIKKYVQSQYGDGFDPFKSLYKKMKLSKYNYKVK